MSELTALDGCIAHLGAVHRGWRQLKPLSSLERYTIVSTCSFSSACSQTKRPFDCPVFERDVNENGSSDAD